MKTTRIALILLSVLFTNKLLAQEVIEEIVVTSSFIEQNLNQIHNPIHVIGADELASMASQSLGESLDDLVGVGTSDYGAAVGHPIIRGLGGTRVKVLNNGRVNRDVSGLGADHVVEIDFNNIQQIEVVRGPSSLFYANGSSGGIINIVDNTIARKDFTESDLTVGYEVQSVNNGNIGELSYENNFGGLNFSLGYRDTDFENYEIPYGAIIHEEHEEEEEEDHHEEEEHHEENPKFLPNTDSATESYKFGVSKTGDWGYLGVSARGLETLYGIPFHGEEHEEEEGHGEHEEERIFANTDSDSFNLEGSYNIRNNWLLEKVDYYASATEYSLKEQHAEEAHHEEEEEEEGHDHEEGPTEFKNDASEVGAVISFVSDQYSQRMMLNAIQEDVSIIGHEAFMKPSDNREFSFGYYLSRDTGLFDWHFGLRHDRISRKGAVAHHEEEEEEDHHEHEEEHEEEVDKFKKEFNTDSMALTLTRDLNDYLEMSFDLASVERAPSAIELYMNGPHLATGRYEEGDTELQIERSRNIDFTLAYQQNAFFGSMTIFQNNIDNFIYLADTGKKEMNMSLAEYKQKDAQLSGIELQFGAAFPFYDGDLELSIARDSVSGEFTDGAYIPRMMPARNIFSVNYKRNTLEFDMSFKDVEKQDKYSINNPLESMTKGYQMLDMKLTQKLVTDSGRVVQASIFGKNMLNEVARNHTSWVKNEVPLPGKNVGINFRVTF